MVLRRIAIMMSLIVTSWSFSGFTWTIYNQTGGSVYYYVDEEGWGPAFESWEGNIPSGGSKSGTTGAANAISHITVEVGYDGTPFTVKMPYRKDPDNDKLAKLKKEGAFSRDVTVTVWENCVKRVYLVDGEEVTTRTCSLGLYEGTPKEAKEAGKIDKIYTKDGGD